MRWVAAALLAAVTVGASAPGLIAQQGGDSAPTAQALTVPRSPILTIDSSRLYPGTLLGQAFVAATQEERRRHAAGNQALAAELRAEELELTELRGTLPREEFARRAQEFDVRVETARRERDDLLAAITARAERQERRFLQQVTPVLGQIMAEAGAVALVEAQTVFLSANAIDITDLAIQRINEATQPIAPVDPLTFAPADPGTDTGSETGINTGAVTGADTDAPSDP